MEKHDLRVPVTGVAPIDQMVGDDELDTQLLREMSSVSEAYLSSFDWCKRIRQTYFGKGYGGIVAVFLYLIEPTRDDVDEWLWVVVGDVPPAYLVVDECRTPSQALEGYIEEMHKWVLLAKANQSSHDVIPVNVPATAENAVLLENRLKVLREVIVPAFRESEIKRA
jgi:hypothetical protein